MKKGIAVLEEPKINHNLNLSMTTSDLIELYIEENITRLEKEWEKLVVKDVQDIAFKNELLALVKKHLKSKLLFDVVSVTGYYNIVNKNIVEVERFSHNVRSLDEAARIKTLAIEKYPQTYGQTTIRSLSISGSNNSNITLDYKDIPAALLTSVNALYPSPEEDKKALLENSRIVKRQWEIIQEYRQISDTRKVKAKFTKKALSNTTEGSKILEFLSTIDSIKALD